MFYKPIQGVICLPSLRQQHYNSSASDDLPHHWGKCMVRGCPPKTVLASCVVDDDSAGAAAPHKSVRNHA